jgi:hypothetical protein
MKAHKKGIAIAALMLCTACGGGGGSSSSPSAPGASPGASIVSPDSGQTVSGVLDYWVSVSPGVTKVEFSVSSASPMFLGTSTTAPFGGSLDTTRLENGSHTLTAVATDAQGRSSTSQVAFTVQNGGATQSSSGATQSGSGATKPASLLFWSGFEGVSVSAPRDCYSSGCWQDVVGTDSVSGFAWPPRIAGGGGQLQVRLGTDSAP